MCGRRFGVIPRERHALSYKASLAQMASAFSDQWLWAKADGQQ